VGPGFSPGHIGGFRFRRLGKNAVRLEECRASFEASLCEAPQDEAFFLTLSMIYLMLRSDPAQLRRVSKHARPPMQRILAQALSVPTHPAVLPVVGTPADLLGCG